MPTAGQLAKRENKRRPVAPIRKSLFADSKDVYLYKAKDGRFQIGPTTSGVCWFFTSQNEDKITTETVFHFANSETRRVYKSKLRFKSVDENLESYESDQPGRELNPSDREKVIGLYVKQASNELYPQIVNCLYVKQQ